MATGLDDVCSIPESCFALLPLRLLDILFFNWVISDAMYKYSISTKILPLMGHIIYINIPAM